MAELLDDAAIDDALASLPGWRRRERTIVKDVPVPEDDVAALVSSVGSVADELNHHPQVDQTAGSVRFTLWTHSAGGVTAKDVELAARIDQALSGPAQDPST